MKRRAKKTEYCLNCEAWQGDANYCPNCGQKNDNHILTLADFVYESLSNFFAFDSRVMRTLKYLFLQPGKVAKLFTEGKRQSFMHPVRLYVLTSVLLLFALEVKEGTPTVVQVGSEQAESMGSSMILDSAQRAEPPVIDTAVNAGAYKSTKMDIEQFAEYAYHYPELESQEALQKMGLKNSFKHRFLYDQVKKSFAFSVEEFNRYYQSKLFWVLFTFVPILALWLWLVYIRHRKGYLYHLFFAFYSQSLFFILLLLATLAASVNPIEENATFTIIVLAFALYLLFSLRRFYQQGWPKTILKFIFLNIVLTISFVLYGILSIIGVYIIF